MLDRTLTACSYKTEGQTKFNTHTHRALLHAQFLSEFQENVTMAFVEQVIEFYALISHHIYIIYYCKWVYTLWQLYYNDT
jgi:hypothetical protein